MNAVDQFAVANASRLRAVGFNVVDVVAYVAGLNGEALIEYADATGSNNLLASLLTAVMNTNDLGSAVLDAKLALLAGLAMTDAVIEDAKEDARRAEDEARAEARL